MRHHDAPETEAERLEAELEVARAVIEELAERIAQLVVVEELVSSVEPVEPAQAARN